jgi:hypothetical protein
MKANWFTELLLGVSKSLLIALAPLIAGALADLLKKATEKAAAFVTKAAEDKTLPDGLARHNFVVNEITPLLRDTAANALPPIRDAVINLAVKAAYDATQPKVK